MKQLLLFLLLLPCFANATTYYCSPTGNDSYPGTVSLPFKTVEKVAAMVHSGDICYFFGGTYQSTKAASSDIFFLMQGMIGTSIAPIQLLAMPGEVPVFDCSNITPTNANPFAFKVVNSTYVKLKGFTIKNLKQISSGTGVSRGLGIQNSDNCTVEWFNVYNIGGTGISVEYSNSFSLINTDSHHNGDGMSDAGGGNRWDFGDGFACTGNDTSTDMLLDGCRFFINGDDGADWFGWQGLKVTIKNSWSFWNSVKPWKVNGRQPSDTGMTPITPSVWKFDAPGMSNWHTSTSSGEGWKLGGCNMSPLTCHTGSTTQVRKLLINVIGAFNSGSGASHNFAEGWTFSHRMQMENCAFFSNFNGGIAGGDGRNTGLKQPIHNTWAWNNNTVVSGADLEYDGSCDSMSNNKWGTTYQAPLSCGNLLGLTINNSDFLSVNDSLLAMPRQSNGNLPITDFLRLQSGSDLRNAGINRWYVTYSDSSPALGPFQFDNGGTTPTPPTSNAGQDYNITLPLDSVTVIGIGTGDPTLSFLWTKISGPVSGTIISNTSSTTKITNLSIGKYQFEFKVTDGNSVSVRDTMTILVFQNATQAPTSIFIRNTVSTGGRIIVDFGSNNITGNSVEFALQRKLSTGAFVTLATTIPFVGTVNYSTIDGTPATGINTYQIRITDKSGITYTQQFSKKK